MITKYILIIVFIHGANSRNNYQTIGEYASLQACQAAAKAVSNAADELGGDRKRLICASTN